MHFLIFNISTYISSVAPHLATDLEKAERNDEVKMKNENKPFDMSI